MVCSAGLALSRQEEKVLAGWAVEGPENIRRAEGPRSEEWWGSACTFSFSDSHGEKAGAPDRVTMVAVLRSCCPPKRKSREDSNKKPENGTTKGVPTSEFLNNARTASIVWPLQILSSFAVGARASAEVQRRMNSWALESASKAFRRAS